MSVLALDSNKNRPFSMNSDCNGVFHYSRASGTTTSTTSVVCVCVCVWDHPANSQSLLAKQRDDRCEFICITRVRIACILFGCASGARLAKEGQREHDSMAPSTRHMFRGPLVLRDLKHIIGVAATAHLRARTQTSCASCVRTHSHAQHNNIKYARTGPVLTNRAKV